LWFVTPVIIRVVRQLTDHPVFVNGYSQLVAMVAATAAMLRIVDVRPWSDAGLGRVAARWRVMVAGFSIGAATNAFVCITLVALGLLRFSSAPTDSTWMPAAFRVSIALLPAALAEELLFRGYLFTVIRDSVGTWAAVVLTSILFGLGHLFNPGVSAEAIIDVMLAGLLLAFVRIAFDSLYAAWMAHFAWNWIMAVPFHVSVSGLPFETPGYKSVTVAPDWLSGGAWGPEGGLIAAFGMMGGLAYLYTRRRREES
jgi:membrane protease YdiL (CAAX protease family)